MIVDPHQVAALCDQAESRTALIRWRALNAPSLPRSAASVAANDLEAIVRPLQSLIDLLLQGRGPTTNKGDSYVTENSEPRLPQRFNNPRACPVCFGIWLFDTDELGRVHRRHPPKKCVPPTYQEADYDPKEIDTEAHPKKRRKCCECRAVMLAPTFGPAKNTLTCSDRCRLSRIARQREAFKRRKREEKRRFWKEAA